MTARAAQLARLPVAVAVQSPEGWPETVALADGHPQGQVLHTTAFAVVLTPGEDRVLAGELLARSPANHDVIDRMARAMYEADGGYMLPWEQAPGGVLDVYRRMARAAVEALRSTT